MKDSITYRSILTVFAIMMIASGLHSQGNDTSKVWINRQDALRKLALAEMVKPLQDKLAAKQVDINTLNEKLLVRDQIIQELKDNISIDSAIIVTYQKEISEKDSQRKLFESDVSSLKHQVRVERRKRKWISLAGILTTIGAFWLGSK